MSDGIYIAVCGAMPVIGFAIGRRARWLAAAPALWAVGLGVAAALGAFDATGEDASAGLLAWTAMATLLWVLLTEVGVLARIAVNDLRGRRPHTKARP